MHIDKRLIYADTLLNGDYRAIPFHEAFIPMETLRNLILSYFLNNNTDKTTYKDLKNYLKDYGMPEIEKQELIHIISDIGIFERTGMTKKEEIIRVNKRKVKYRCDKYGISKNQVDEYGNKNILGLRTTGYKKFGIGIANKLKSTDPYRTVHWRTFPGYFFDPYKNVIEVVKRSGNEWEYLTPISIGAASLTRDQTDYKRMIWNIMNGLETMETLGTNVPKLDYNHGNKSFSNKINWYLPELEEAISALEGVGFEISIDQRKKAVKLLANFNINDFQGIRNNKKCRKFHKKFYSPVVNASFIMYVLESEGANIPNTRQCKFLRTIGWTKCRYEFIKEIISTKEEEAIYI